MKTIRQRRTIAACYCRLSDDDDQDGTSVSIETQTKNSERNRVFYRTGNGDGEVAVGGEIYKKEIEKDVARKFMTICR